MKMLIGMPQAEHAALIIGRQSGLQPVVANTAEQFFARIDDGYELITVHCGLFPTTYPWDWLYAIRQANPHAKVAIALSEACYHSMYTDVIHELAGNFGFHLIPWGLTNEEAAAAIRAIFFGGTSERGTSGGRIVTVMSCASKDGATTVATGAALSFARLTGLSVALFDLNLKAPDLKDNLNLADKGRHLLALRPGCASGTLMPDDLRKMCLPYERQSNLQLLVGTNRRDTAGDWTLEQIRTLLDTARETFDLVFADVHSFPDNAATVYAMKHADERWLVAQPLFSSYRSGWKDWYDCFWRHCGLSGEDFSLVVNRIVEKGGVKAGTIAAELGMEMIGQLPNVGGGHGLKAINEGVPLILQPEAGHFAAEVRKLAEDLACRIGAAVSFGGSAERAGRFNRLFASILAAWNS